MELVKNIFFNTDKLIENTVVKISYTGKIYQNDCDKVFVHYGFGDNWENTNEKEMVKTELGYQVEINIESFESLNLCFRSNNDEWDNNDNNNYVFAIEPEPVALAVVDDSVYVSPRRLRRSYLWSKKIRIAIYKIITYVPKLISGSYKKKIRNND